MASRLQRGPSSQRHRQQGADIAHERPRRIPSAVSLSPENPPAGRSKIGVHLKGHHGLSLEPEEKRVSGHRVSDVVMVRCFIMLSPVSSMRYAWRPSFSYTTPWNTVHSTPSSDKIAVVVRSSIRKLWGGKACALSFGRSTDMPFIEVLTARTTGRRLSWRSQAPTLTRTIRTGPFEKSNAQIKGI